MFPRAMTDMIKAFKRLPGIGPKAAYRMAVYMLNLPYEEVREIARAIVGARKAIRLCPQCYNFTDVDPCRICADEKRDKTFICVVEEPEDVEAIEMSRGHAGVYHVLGGALSPVSGVGPERLRIDELVKRVKRDKVVEVLIATDPSVEGEATAMYIAKLLKPLGVRPTRPARGIPAGADLNYIDGATLTQAIKSRQEM